MRRFVAVVIAAAGLVLAGDGVRAQTCVALQAEIEYLQGRGGGSSRDRARYERAYREQANVLARTEARARNAGCFGGGFLFFRREVDRACGTLVPKLRDMQLNLARLDRLRRQGGGNTRRVRQLQSAMAARGCGLPGEDMWDEPPQRRQAIEPEAPFSQRGTFRTLCVRTCDGYYFPISFSTTQEQFGSDAQTCASMCPGAESRLFFHPNPGGGPETMMSIDGQAYSSLPAAFQYRTSLNPSCTCKPAGGFSPIPANTPAPGRIAEPAEAAAPLPRPRAAPGEDPETLANRLGGFVPRAASGDNATATAARGADGQSVRVIGPAYWASPEQEAVIIAPVPN